jgi:antitoxin ParD1/3/4
MSKNTSITIGPHFDEFIENQIQTGRYSSASEVIRAGLRLLEDSDLKLEILRNLLDEGEDSGIANYTYEEFISELDGDEN